MKQSRTAIKELTAAYRAVLKHALIASMSMVVVMPAMAEETKTPIKVNPGAPFVVEAGTVYEGYENDNIGGVIAITKPAGEAVIKGDANSYVEFRDNSAIYDGGSIGNYGKLSADFVKFIGNKSQTTSSDSQPIGGGAISLGVDSQTTISNSIFENNETGYNGGAIGTRRTLQANEKPTGNLADGGNFLKIYDSDFIGNKATGTTTDKVDGKKVGGYGGAIANTFETAEITGSTFAENTAENGGGAVYLTGFIAANKNGVGGGQKTGKGGKITISDSLFEGNSSFQGGAILSGTSAQELIVKESEFNGNIAKVGGAAIWSGAKTDVVNTTFDGNKVTGTTYEDDMNDDTAEGGAAIFVGSSSHTTITGSTFTNNESGTVGGAIATRSNSSGKTSSLTIEDSTFKDNKAAISGGAINIASEHENVILKGTNTFTGNKAEAGADIFNNGQLKIADGKTIIDGGIAGDGSMTIAEKATLNIGDATVEQKSITLDGNMIANLSDRGDKAIVTADEFTGNGKMSLIAKSEGEYKVFGDAVFGNVQVDVNSVLYNMAWNEDKTSVVLGMKSVQDIAADNNLTGNTSQTVLNLIMADSDKLNDFGLLVQEHLSNGNSVAVEDAHKAINPVNTPVVQSVASQVQGSVAKLTAERMNIPSVGRAGGDVDLTAGGVWAQGLFNKSKKNGEYNGYTRGVAAGIDGTINRSWTIGAGYAFNHSDVNLNSRDTEIDSNTLFLYGQYKPSAWFANATLNYTMSDYSEDASALGVAIDADYKINAFGGQIMTGYDFENGLTPEMGIRYLHLDGDSYTNSLGIRNKIDDADYLTAILGGRYAKSFAVSGGLNLRPEVRLAAKYDLLSDDYDTAVTMPGINSYSVKADSLNRFGGEAGLGITMSYKELDLSLTYDIEFRKDYTSQTGMLKARYNF